VNPARIGGCLGFTLSRQLGGLRVRSGETLADFWARQNEAFGRAVTAANWAAADTVYAFNGCALEVFLEARRRGLRCVLDQSAAPWRYNTAMLGREQQRWPGWENQPADMDTGGRMIEREEAEWKLADRIVCGSRFVLDAIKTVGGPAHKTTVVTYPTPSAPPAPRRRPGGGTTHVLFVGTLQLRKGIQYFAQVANQLSGGRFVFRAIGPSLLTPSAEKRVRERVDWWGPVPRSQVWDQYRWADVFLLPTLSEGSANVCLEAVSSGLPVITSLASGLVNSDERSMLTSGSDIDTIVARLEALTSSDWEKHTDCAVPDRSVVEYGRDLVDAVAHSSTNSSVTDIEG
jgi:glycosyltransferase involved in cell wall biosynthesis